jgi:hypothetical protein
VKPTLWSALGECVIAVGFLAYGLTRKPLHFNEFNPVKRPMSVLTATGLTSYGSTDSLLWHPRPDSRHALSVIMARRH